MTSVFASVRETIAAETVIHIEFTAEQIAGLREEADRRHLKMVGRSPSYGSTTPQRQFVGVLGEAAVTLWLHQRLTGSEFAVPPEGQADVYVRLPDNKGWTLIEVKSHQPDFWHTHGRTMNAQQLSRMSADLVAWCVIPTPLGSEAYVVGWSPLADVRASATPEPEEWLGVRINARLRTPTELTTWLASGRGEAISGTAG